jgi:hypothetical protein
MFARYEIASAKEADALHIPRKLTMGIMISPTEYYPYRGLSITT